MARHCEAKSGFLFEKKLFSSFFLLFFLFLCIALLGRMPSLKAPVYCSEGRSSCLTLCRLCPEHQLICQGFQLHCAVAAVGPTSLQLVVVWQCSSWWSRPLLWSRLVAQKSDLWRPSVTHLHPGHNRQSRHWQWPCQKGRRLSCTRPWTGKSLGSSSSYYPQYQYLSCQHFNSLPLNGLSPSIAVVWTVDSMVSAGVLPLQGQEPYLSFSSHLGPWAWTSCSPRFPLSHSSFMPATNKRDLVMCTSCPQTIGIPSQRSRCLHQMEHCFCGQGHVATVLPSVHSETRCVPCCLTGIGTELMGLQPEPLVVGLKS